MKSFNKLAATLAFVPVVAISGSAFAGSPGQLAGGDNYLVKNLTQHGSYGNNVSATCNDEVEYTMQLSNTQFGALNDVTLKVTLPSAGGLSTATATTDLGGTSGTSDTATLNIGAGQTQTLENGTTVLYDGNDNAIKTLPDTVNTSGVNIGTLVGSTTEFVNFKAKISCPTPPPPPVYTCDELDITAESNRTVKISVFNVTAKNGATFKNADISWGDGASSNGLNPVVGTTHQYGKDGTYTIAAMARFVANGGEMVVGGPNCEKMVTFKTNTPPVITPVTTPTTPATPAPTTLVNTGAGNVVGIFAAVSAAGAVAYRWVTSRRLSRQ